MSQYTSPEGILVSDKNQSSYIKPFVDDINQQIMFAEKSWGNFRVMFWLSHKPHALKCHVLHQC